MPDECAPGPHTQHSRPPPTRLLSSARSLPLTSFSTDLLVLLSQDNKGLMLPWLIMIAIVTMFEVCVAGYLLSETVRKTVRNSFHHSIVSAVWISMKSLCLHTKCRNFGGSMLNRTPRAMQCVGSSISSLDCGGEAD